MFANSSASLAVRPNDPGDNAFVIPVQYLVGAGASRHAVGLGAEIVSNINNVAAVRDTWDVAYATAPPQKGPELRRSRDKAPANSIDISTNIFHDTVGGTNDWFANLSFGIQTFEGYIGLSWSPKPNWTRGLTPRLKFYVSVGSFNNYTLVSWNEVAKSAAVIEAPASFDRNACTVSYTQAGGWRVTRGPPRKV